MAKQICGHCGTVDRTKRQARGSLLGEVALWFLMVIIGPFTAYISIFIAVVFSLWRAIDKKSICAECGHDELIGVGTPRGKQIFEKYHTGQ